MTRNNLELDDLHEALLMLDEELTLQNNKQHIEVKAIGGFAMLYHGMRIKGVTADIDTITPTY